MTAEVDDRYEDELGVGTVWGRHQTGTVQDAVDSRDFSKD